KSIGHEYFSVIESLEQALEEIRGISKGLVLPELENLSLEKCIRKVVVLHRSKVRNLEIEEFYAELAQPVDLSIKICAYRFVQEALNNATRHGQAKRCKVKAELIDGVLTVSVKDDGMGFRVSKLQSDNNRLGLLGLRDRVESIGGKFSINSVLGVGTALKLSFSLPENDK
ncbi:MAG: ATP-binding protein, partial [Pseudomonadota bacterium]